MSRFISRHPKIIFLPVLALLLLFLPGVRRAFADYLGPHRVITEYETETYDVGVWARHEYYDGECAPYLYSAHDCIICTWEGDPGHPCGDATYWYKTGEETKVVSKTTQLPEATITGTLENCGLQNGWCTAAATLHLSGEEPLDGYSISLIEGTLNGQSFACAANPCDVPLVAGANDFTYWALSTYGDSSRMGTLSAQVDGAPPVIRGSLSGAPGTNGWFTSAATLTASASDPAPGSGLDVFETSVNGAGWVPYAAPLSFTDGVYSVELRAADVAGNSRN